MKNKGFDSQCSAPSPQSSMDGPSCAIREASHVTHIPSYILRYWEANRLIAPVRTSRGHRRYRPSDIERILKVKELFYIKKMRLEGVKGALAEEARKRQKSSKLPLELVAQSAAAEVLSETKRVLKEILQILG